MQSVINVRSLIFDFSVELSKWCRNFNANSLKRRGQSSKMPNEHHKDNKLIEIDHFFFSIFSLIKFFWCLSVFFRNILVRETVFFDYFDKKFLDSQCTLEGNTGALKCERKIWGLWKLYTKCFWLKTPNFRKK